MKTDRTVEQAQLLLTTLRQARQAIGAGDRSIYANVEAAAADYRRTANEAIDFLLEQYLADDPRDLRKAGDD